MLTSTSYLQGAHDFRIDTLSITHVSGKARRSALEYLEDHIVVGAIHDSDERCDAPTCFPETRIAVQEDAVGWITQRDQSDLPRHLMWISGPAGSGKTAIAGSVAETCHDRNILAATFFFSSYSPSPERSSKRYLVSTLVYQLLQHEALRVLEEHVVGAIHRDKAIFKKRLKEQFEALILKPLRRVRGQLGGDIPRVIIIDGVDEVKVDRSNASSRHTAPRRDEDDHLEIISCLLHAAKDPAFPFRIIIVSRPERVFTDFFPTQTVALGKQLFLNSKYDPDADIRLYLQSKFAEMRRRYGLPPSWPGEEVVEHIVWSSSGQFVYAATVIRFVANGESPPPAQLDVLFPLRPLPRNRSVRGLSSLDTLYADVLMSSPNPKLAAQWIGGIYELPTTPAWVLRNILESEVGQGEHILRPLASLISIPDLAKERKEPYRIYHKSLIDFLKDGSRCPQSAYDQHQGTLLFARAWIRLGTNKAPMTPLTPPEEKEFFGALAHRSVLGSITFCVLHQWNGLIEEEICACDMYWWTSQMLQNRGALTGWGFILEARHRKCFDLDGPCRESCRKWSGDMFQAFVDQGWTIPSAETWRVFLNEKDRTERSRIRVELKQSFNPPKKQ